MSDEKKKVLIIHSSPWNDDISKNNVLTNWFSGLDVQIANVYRGSGRPKNDCCKKYFQITDKMMIKSLLFGKPAGRSFEIEESEETTRHSKQTTSGIVKKFSCEFTRFCRSLIWCIGRVNKKELKIFIENFSPDVVYTCRKASLATLRLERIIRKYTKAPFVAFTGDDEYSLRQFRFAPFFWIDRFLVRRSLKRNVKFYTKYLTLSEWQAEEYEKIFKLPTAVMRKCSSVQLYDENKSCHQPIKLVYAGKLYCNRWKTLANISEAIVKINEELGRKALELEIYAVGQVSKKERKAICISDAIKIFPAVSSNKLLEVYKNSDIVLHVEAFDRRNRLDTRFSFSTKIIDCLSSGCAIMAICWEKQSGYAYLKNEDAAICISDRNEIYKKLCEIASNPKIVEQYAKKANDCVEKNHLKEKVQQEILTHFSS
jgi:glycosyltransferase involved in cell wall biosynthesis